MINKQAASGFKPETILKALLNRKKGLIENLKRVGKTYDEIAAQHVAKSRKFSDSLRQYGEINSIPDDNIRAAIGKYNKSLNVEPGATATLTDRTYFMNPEKHSVNLKSHIRDLEGTYFNPQLSDALIKSTLKENINKSKGSMGYLIENSRSTDAEVAERIQNVLNAVENKKIEKGLWKLQKRVNSPEYLDFVNKQNNKILKKKLLKDFNFDVNNL